jgi:hypothetical protein
VAAFNEVVFLLIVSRVLVVFMGSAIYVNLVLYSSVVMIDDLGVAALGGGTSVIVDSTLEKTGVFWRLNHVEGLGSE